MMLLRIQEAFRFWHRHFVSLLLVCLPFAVLTFGAELLLGQMLTVDDQGRLTGVNLPAALVVLSLRVWADGALIGQLGAIQSGRPRGVGECMLFGLTVFPALVLVELAVSAATSLGLLLLVVPGLWAYVRLSLSHFAVALEGATPGVALQRSVQRTRVPQWIMLGSWSLLMLLGAFVTGLVGDLGREVTAAGLLTTLTGLMMRALAMVLLFRFHVLAREQEGQTGGRE